MPERRWLRPEHAAALAVGVEWERTKGHQYEAAVVILKLIHSRIGERYLVEGLTSGRQWFVNLDTLLESYRPRAAR